MLSLFKLWASGTFAGSPPPTGAGSLAGALTSEQPPGERRLRRHPAVAEGGNSVDPMGHAMNSSHHSGLSGQPGLTSAGIDPPVLFIPGPPCFPSDANKVGSIRTTSVLRSFPPLV
jgi:hypothetical protein